MEDGLLLATMLSGVVLLVIGHFRGGDIHQIHPLPVTCRV